MTARKQSDTPRRATVVYSWVVIRPSKRSKQPVRVECMWSLKGGNGEHMCGSWPEGYRDATDARRAVEAVTSALFGRTGPDGLVLPKHEGPGERPKDDQ